MSGVDRGLGRTLRCGTTSSATADTLWRNASLCKNVILGCSSPARGAESRRVVPVNPSLCKNAPGSDDPASLRALCNVTLRLDANLRKHPSRPPEGAHHCVTLWFRALEARRPVIGQSLCKSALRRAVRNLNARSDRPRMVWPFFRREILSPRILCRKYFHAGKTGSPSHCALVSGLRERNLCSHRSNSYPRSSRLLNTSRIRSP